MRGYKKDDEDRDHNHEGCDACGTEGVDDEKFKVREVAVETNAEHCPEFEKHVHMVSREEGMNFCKLPVLVEEDGRN